MTAWISVLFHRCPTPQRRIIFVSRFIGNTECPTCRLLLGRKCTVRVSLKQASRRLASSIRLYSTSGLFVNVKNFTLTSRLGNERPNVRWIPVPIYLFCRAMTRADLNSQNALTCRFSDCKVFFLDQVKIAFRHKIKIASSRGTIMLKQARDRRYDAKRRELKPWRNRYKRAVWLRIRGLRLAETPLCKTCEENGVVTAADTVDHVKPHRGDPGLFFWYANTQSLCTSCHNSRKQSEEARGYNKAIGTDGWPIDPFHPANQVEGAG